MMSIYIDISVLTYMDTKSDASGVLAFMKVWDKNNSELDTAHTYPRTQSPIQVQRKPIAAYLQ